MISGNVVTGCFLRRLGAIRERECATMKPLRLQRVTLPTGGDVPRIHFGVLFNIGAWCTVHSTQKSNALAETQFRKVQ